MLLVLIAVTIATILSMSFLSSQATTHGVAQNVQKHAQARSVAESALVAAIHYVQTDSNFRSDKTHGQWATNVSFNGGTFDIYGYDGLDTDGDGVVDDTDGDLADDPNDPVTLTVVGYYDGVSHTVHAQVTPGGGGFAQTVLMVVDDAQSLDTRETQRRDLMQDWGWAVNIIQDSDSQANYNAALADADVVLIPETVNASSVGTKLKGTSLGVVTEEPALIDDFGIASSYATYNDDACQVIQNSHYITSAFSTGSLTVATTTGAMGRPSGSLASGATTLANAPGGGAAAVVAVETGAALYGSGIAAGRRVTLPTGPFSVDDLSDDGKTLLERALTWAGGGDADNFLAGHWTLDEGQGLTVYDSSGNGQHGPITAGSPSTQWTQGQVFGGLRFDGSGNGFIRIPDSDVLDLSDEGTLSAWIYLEGYKNFMGIIHKGEFRDWSDEAYSLQFWTNRKLAITFTTATGTKKLIGNQKLQNGQWYHVAGTWGPNGMALYVNGELDASNNIAAVGVPSIGSVQIGSQLSENYNSYYKNLPFIGIIDDARIYRRTLTADEIRAQYEQAIGSDDTPQLIALYEFEEVTPPVPAPVGHWKLDDSAAGGSGGGIAGAGTVQIKKNAYIDSYDASLGAYGSGGNLGSDVVLGSNTTASGDMDIDNKAVIKGDVYVGVGGNPNSVITGGNGITGSKQALSDPITFPTLSAPSGMPPSQGDKSLSGNITWNSDLTYDDLEITKNANITVNGNVTVHVTKSLIAKGNVSLTIPSGSSLTLYVKEDVKFEKNNNINGDSAATNRLTLIQYLPGKTVTLEKNSVFAGLIDTESKIVIKKNADFYGAMRAQDEILFEENTSIHVDVSMADLVTGGASSVTATDETGLNDGTGYGGVTAQVQGHGDGGTAFQFDGNDDYVLIPHDPSYLLNSGAVSLWFKADSLSGHTGIFSKDSQNYDTGGHLHIYTDGSTLKARIQSTNNSYTLQSSGLTTGQWYHVVVSFGTGGFKLYRNGVLVDSDSYTGGIGSNSGGIGNHEPIVLGANTWISDDLQHTPLIGYFDGSIDEVRFYDQALNDAQVAELYADTDPSAGPATVVYDTSGYGAPLNLDIEDPAKVTWEPGGGLTFTSPTRVSSPTSALKLYNALTATNQLSLEVTFTPANVSQSGPARIVSYSGGSSTRNFTFGQDGDAYVTRLRTDTTTSNGTPEADSGSVLTAGVQEHVIVSYDGANITMYRADGSSTTLARTGDFNWDNSFKFMFGDEIDGGREWLGTLHRVAIYDKAFNQTQANNVFAGNEPGDGSAAGEGSVNWVEP